MKKIFSILMTAIMIMAFASPIADAATIKWPATSNIKTYVISTKNDTTVYQTAYSLKKYGTIYATDLITINGYSGSRLKVTYPISGGTKTGYISKSAVTSSSINKAQKKWTAAAQITTYRRSSGGTTLGYVSKNDVCYSIASANGRTQIIYPVSGGYKMGWISTSAISSTDNSTSATKSFNPVWPCPKHYTVTCLSKYSSGSAHSAKYASSSAMDISAPSGAKVVAVEAGTVETAKYDTSSGFGNYIIIRHSNGKKSLYAHLSAITSGIKAGVSVKQNQQIGKVGNTSAKYKLGYHLHFELSGSKPYQDYFKAKYKDIKLTQAAGKWGY